MPNSSPSYTTIGDMTRESLHSQTLEMETLAKMTALNRLFNAFFSFSKKICLRIRNPIKSRQELSRANGVWVLKISNS